MNGWQASRARHAPHQGVSGSPGSRAVPSEVALLISGHPRGTSFGTVLVLSLSRLCDALALLRREGVAQVTVNEDPLVPCPLNRWRC